MVSRTSTCDFEVILGTYENFVLGYAFTSKLKEIILNFAINPHQGSIRSLASSSDYVASGATDEIIQLFNMGIRKGAGSIMQHSGTVTSLQFTPDGSHLISASNDGSIAVYRTGSWELDKVWTNAHQGSAVKCISIHPTGKLALSVAENRSLKTWNLIKGRAAYTTNLSHLGTYIDQVIWSSKGSYYAIPVDHRIHVFDISVAGIKCVISCASKITSISFIEDNVIVFGEKDGWIIGYDVESNEELWKIQASSNRIKCLTIAPPNWLISAASNGELIVWEVPSMNKKPIKIASVNCDCRVLCLSIHQTKIKM